jgi:hypothetical protein
VLYARDRGCTRPGCTASAYWCEAHHDDGWAAGDSPTDINRLSLACPADNKLIETTGWTTPRRKDGRTQWIPPPSLDKGQAASTTITTPSATSSPMMTTVSHRRSGLRFNIHAGIQCVTDRRLGP